MLENNGITLKMNFNKALRKAHITFIMSIYAKYYINIDINTIKSTTGITKTELKAQEYKIDGDFLILN